MLDLFEATADSQDPRWLPVFLEDGPLVHHFRALGVEARVVDAGRLRNVRQFARAIHAIASIAKREQADLLFGWMVKAHLYESLAAKVVGVPSAWYQHSFPSRGSWLERAAAALPTDAILACSDAVADAQRRLSPATRIVVVRPGIDLARFERESHPPPLEARRLLGLPSKGPLIGIVGRLQRWKGIHVLIGAMPLVIERFPDAQCVVVGGEHELEPDYHSFLEREICALGLSNQVHLVGYQADVPIWMQAFDIVVHASNNEPLGLVILEAMALGKPVIAADTPGPREIITNDVEGLLTSYGDSRELAEAISKYLSDREYAERVGARGLIRVGAFSREAYSARLIGSLRALTPRV